MLVLSRKVGESVSIGGDVVVTVIEFTSKGKTIEDIKGFGPAKAEQLQDAMEKLWASRNASE